LIQYALLHDFFHTSEHRSKIYVEPEIDFVALANEIKKNEIKKASTHSSKLYWYILNNKELNRLNESLEHGHSSLRNHLLVIANLIVHDFQQGRLKDSLHTERDRLPLPSKCG